MTLSYNEFAGRSVERLGSLSDSVVAFAMTLLVLDLRVPALDVVHSEHDLRHALAAIAPNLLTYVLSFMTLGIFWVGQHTELSKIKHSERSLTWIHLAFLTYRTALIVYWLNIVLLCLINTYVSIAFIILVQLNYVIAPRLGILGRI
jgi:Endosomal/lysosomal potassium channel TMEM175